MFTIRVNADGVNFGTLNIVNTGHVKDGLTLYRIKDPKMNHIDIWHKRDNSWEYLVSSAMNALIIEKERKG